MQELIMLCGLPASGKSTIAQQYYEKGYEVLSSDRMRIELFGDVNNQENNVKLFETLYREARQLLYNRFNVVIDATNISSKYRISGLESILKNTRKDKIQLDKNNINVIAEIIACPYNECLDRNKTRDRKVIAGVIEGMYKSWQTPITQEGFDEVRVIYTSETEFDIDEELKFLSTVPQFNKNHTLSIGAHCNKVGDNLLFNFELNIIFAGWLHDVGKLFCMQFKDSQGRVSKEAHFYSHESVSAYDSLFYFRDKEYKNYILYTSQLITWHMLPHILGSEKSINKYKSFLGEEFWLDLMKLHEADKEGR